MASSWPENSSNHKEKVIDEMIRGCEFANQLQFMLSNFKNDGSVFPEDLVMKIIGSFTQTLSILHSGDSDEVSQIPPNSHSDEVSQIPPNTSVNSPSRDGRKSEDSGESNQTSTFKDRTGCYKRRKTSRTLTIYIPALIVSIEDGHSWRKCGQKEILDAKYPRVAQGCQATKQVQRTCEDDQPMYRTTYHGPHPCRNLLEAPQIISDSQSSSSENLLSRDLSGSITVLPSGPDHGNVISSGVYSCTASPQSFEMDRNGSVDLDDVADEYDGICGICCCDVSAQYYEYDGNCGF